MKNSDWRTSNQGKLQVPTELLATVQGVQFIYRGYCLCFVKVECPWVSSQKITCCVSRYDQWSVPQIRKQF